MVDSPNDGEQGRDETEESRKLEGLRSRPEYRLWHVISHVHSAALMHRHLREFEERKAETRRRWGGRNPRSDDPEERRGVLEGKGLHDAPYNMPVEYVDHLVEQMRAGSTACEDALAAIRDGGAEVLDLALNPGTHAKSVELHRQLQEAQATFSVLATFLRMADAAFDDKVEQLAAIAKWARETGGELTAVLEMQHRLAPAPSKDQSSRIQRPDFHLTDDLRATSDPLWQNLLKFRRLLMEGQGNGQWLSLLVQIQMGAAEAGLRPHMGEVESIVADLREAREKDPIGGWDDESDEGSKVVLIECGKGGRITVVDLFDGFADPSEREAAIGWAESWMNARERQLCRGPVPEGWQGSREPEQGRAAAGEKVAEDSDFGGNPFRRLAGILEYIRDAWVRGDREVADWALELKTSTGGFEKLGRAARESVDQFIEVLDDHVIPACLPLCDPSLRDQIQRVIGLLRPDAILPDRYGEASARWRQTWEAMDLKAEFEDLIPKLRAAAEQNRCKEFTSAGSSAPILTAANAANDVNGLPAATKSRQKGKWPPLPEIGSSNDPQREVREQTLPRSLTAIGRVIEIKDYRTIEGMIQKGEIWAYRHSKKRWRLDYDQIDARWGRVAANLLV